VKEIKISNLTAVLKENLRICVFGSGQGGSIVKQELENSTDKKINIVCFLDSFRGGYVKEGINVIKFDEFVTKNINFDTILVASDYWQEIEKIITKEDIENYLIVKFEKNVKRNCQNLSPKLHSDFISSIILWGIDSQTVEFVRYLRKTNGVKIKYIFDNKYKSNFFEGLEVIQEKKELSKKQFDFIVISNINKNSEQWFEKSLEDIALFDKNYLVKVLHPLFLCDFVELDYRQKIVKTGFPGSGNILMFKLLSGLLEVNNSFSLGLKENLFAYLQEHHEKRLKAFFNSELHINDKGVLGQDNLKNASFKQSNSETHVRISGIPFRSYYNESNTFFCHFPVSDSLLSFCKEKKFKIFVSVRHPLDILLSEVSKIDGEICRNVDKFNISGKLKFKNQIALARLFNFEDFEQKIKVIIKFYSYLLSNKEVFWLQFEDLLKNPDENLKRLCLHFGLNVNNETINTIWNKYAFKPLGSNLSHYNNPKIEKWKLYLNKKHYDIIENTVINGYKIKYILENFQYNSIKKEDFQGKSFFSYTNLDNDLKKALAFSNPRGYSYGFKMEKIFYPYNKHIEITTNASDLIEKFRKSVKNDKATALFTEILK